MPVKHTRNYLPLALAAATALASGHAAAQLEEVVVTAQKRTESLQDTPIAMSAYNEEAIESMGLINAKDVGMASPSLQMPAYPFTNNNLALYIRGIGNADSISLLKDPTVGVYYDGVYTARSTGLLSDLSDLERVEILRGPQGTLYGRNTTAGAVSFFNAKPTGELGFKQTLSAGNYDSWRSVSHLNLPGAGGFMAKLSATFSDRDGWVENEGPNQVPGQPYNDYYKKESEGYRVALRYDGIERLLVDYSYDYSDVTHTPAYFQFTGVAGGTDAAGTPITHAFNDRLDNTRTPLGGGKFAYYLPDSETDVEGHNLTFSYDFGEGMTFKSITGYREFDDDVSQNFSQSFGAAGSLNTHTLTDHEQFSQEFQVLLSEERFDYVFGAYYFEESGDQSERQYLDRALVDEQGILAIDLTNGMPCSDGRNAAPVCTDFGAAFPAYLGEYGMSMDVESWAVFSQVTWNPAILQDRLDLTLGLRYTDDDRKSNRTWDAWPFNSFMPGQAASDEQKVDYTAIANYNWTDTVSTYAKMATGFRSGGSSRNGLDFNQAFESEDLVSYELGLKSELLDRRLRLNAAAFYMEIDDIILDNLPDPVNNPQFVQVFNSGDAEIWGVELDAQAMLGEYFLVGLNYAYLDYEINDAIFPDGSDRTDITELLWAPENAWTLTADYNLPIALGELRFHLDYAWQGDQFALANTEFGEVTVEDFGRLNGRISLASMDMLGGTWQFAIWGRNLTDEDSPNYRIGSTARTFQPPRMYGGDIIFEF